MIPRAVFTAALALAFSVGAGAGSAPAEPDGAGCGARVDKLSAPIPTRGDVKVFGISPDGSRVVYRADGEADEVWDLYSAGLLGGPVVRYDRPFEPEGKAGRFVFSPGSDRVVFWAYRVSPNIGQLFSVPIEGGSLTPLSQALPGHRGVVEWGFEINSPGDRVVFLAEYDYAIDELFSVRIDGGPVTRLNLPDPPGDIRWFRISPDGSKVWYLGEQETDDIRELYLVPLGIGVVTKLNEPLVPGGEVVRAQFTPDGNYVVYVTDKHVVDVLELWSIRLSDMQRFRLSPEPVAGGEVYLNPLVTPDSSRVVYRGDLDVNEQFELYSVGIEGGPTTKLNGPMTPGGGVYYPVGFSISSDGSTVVYKADQDIEYAYELYSVPVAGGTVTKLNPPFPAGRRVIDFAIDPTSSRVVYTADQDTDNVVELYGVPIGGGATTKLNAPYIPTGDTQTFVISPDGSSVAYRADQEVDRVYELYEVPVTGGAATKLNGPLVEGGDVFNDPYRTGEEFRFDPGTNLVAYIADQEVNNSRELYRSLLPHRDTDGDLQDNCVDPCPLDVDDDADHDGYCADVDCAPADGNLWQVPGQVVDLVLDRVGDPPGTTLLTWSTPPEPGGTPSPSYDTVRTTAVADFGPESTVCIESDDGADTAAADTEVPATLFAYLVVPSNACGRTPGAAVTTVTRQIRECP